MFDISGLFAFHDLAHSHGGSSDCGHNHGGHTTHGSHVTSPAVGADDHDHAHASSCQHTHSAACAHADVHVGVGCDEQPRRDASCNHSKNTNLSGVRASAWGLMRIACDSTTQVYLHIMADTLGSLGVAVAFASHEPLSPPALQA